MKKIKGRILAFCLAVLLVCDPVTRPVRANDTESQMTTEITAEDREEAEEETKAFEEAAEGGEAPAEEAVSETEAVAEEVTEEKAEEENVSSEAETAAETVREEESETLSEEVTELEGETSSLEEETEKETVAAAEKAEEKVTKASAEERAEMETETVTDVEEETEAGTEEETETVTEAVTKEVTEPVTEAVTEEVTEEILEKITSQELPDNRPLVERIRGLSEEETYEILKEYDSSEIIRLYLRLEGTEPINRKTNDYYHFREAMYRLLSERAPKRAGQNMTSYSGGSAQVTSYEKLGDDKLNVGKFTIRAGGVSMNAFCMHHVLKPPKEGETLTVLETAEVTNKDKGTWEYDYARLVYFMYEDADTAFQIMKDMYDNHHDAPDPYRGLYKRGMNPNTASAAKLTEYRQICVALAGSYLNGVEEKGGSSTGKLRYGGEGYDDFYEIGAAVWAYLNDTDFCPADLPEGVGVKLVFTYPEDNAMQPLLGWKPYEVPTTGEAYVQKTSANPAMTAGNSCYQMAGIQYTLYTNSSCTSVAKDEDGNNAVLTLNGSGKSNVIKLAAGTYYAKETYLPANCGYLPS